MHQNHKHSPYQIDDIVLKNALATYNLTQENIYYGAGQQITTQMGNIIVKEGLTYEETKISRMTLTSVGIAIATTHFEQATGEELDIDIWIN